MAKIEINFSKNNGFVAKSKDEVLREYLQYDFEQTDDTPQGIERAYDIKQFATSCGFHQLAIDFHKELLLSPGYKVMLTAISHDQEGDTQYDFLTTEIPLIR
ncbi:MAG: hypothetical protein KBF32_11525 [Chitinophagales bacterium]|nr:hypothetical protein [Chitinophagales bacterium]